MIGWEIQVLKQADGGYAPSTMESERGSLLAVWLTSDAGALRWLDNLAIAGKAIALGGNGYPIRFTAAADNLIPLIIRQPVRAMSSQLCDGLRNASVLQTVPELLTAANCRTGEWLLVEACRLEEE